MSGDSGWNAVIHHPSELELQNWDWVGGPDDEPEQELPSTVDMDAIKDSGNWNPVTGVTTVHSVEDSDSDDESSDGSGSCSDSNSDTDNDSSDGDSETNSDCSSDHSEQAFSIRETNFEQGGLKLKISMKIPRKEDLAKLRYERNKRLLPRRTKNHSNKIPDCSSDDSDSSISQIPCSKVQQHLMAQQAKLSRLKEQQALEQRQQQQELQQQSQLPNTLNHSATKAEMYPQSSQPPPPQLLPSSQSATQPLQEINQEDLAAILPEPEHEDTAFDGFEDSESGRLVSKAIERMTLGADDSDSSENVRQPYSSSLLQQFVEKTALLSKRRNASSKQPPQQHSLLQQSSQAASKPRDSEYALLSNVSPDSGIQSVDNSPLHLVSPVSPPVSVATAIPVIALPDKPANIVSATVANPGLTHNNNNHSKNNNNNNNNNNHSKNFSSIAPVIAATNVVASTSGPATINCSPSAAVKAAIAAKAHPVVNVDRVENPPKRKPGRPAKISNLSTAQPRGPGRPKLRPDAAKKDNHSASLGKEAAPCLKRAKVVVSQCTKPSAKQHHRQLESEERKRTKGRKPGRKAAEKKPEDGDGKVCLTRKKCLSSKPDKASLGKRAKEMPVEEQPSKRVRRDTLAKKEVAHSSLDDAATAKLDGKKSSKENRLDTMSLSKRQLSTRKSQQPTRRILKENKANKKAANAANNNNDHILETNGVAVQTIISLPVINPMRIVDDDRKGSSNGESHRHHHHHKHRRRAPPPKTPIRVDPSVGQELERIVEEFAKLCSLGQIDTSGEAYGSNGAVVVRKIGELLPQIFGRVKKLGKKRKGGSCDTSTSAEQHGNRKVKRRVKKEKANSGSSSGSNSSNASVSESSNPNEQRLPLKKRHYHVLSVHSNAQDRQVDEEDDEHDDEVDERDEDEDNNEEEDENEGGSSSDNQAEEPAGEVKRPPETSSQATQKEPANPLPPVAIESKKRQRESSDSVTSDKTETDASELAEDKLQHQADSQPRRKKKIVKDLRVTVTKLPVENNHVIDKIEKLEKMCAGDKTIKPPAEKSPKADKVSIDKIAKVQLDKPETRSSDRPERIAKNKQPKDEKESSSSRSVKKDSEVVKLGKRDAEASKVAKKDTDSDSKVAKKDVDTSCKAAKKDKDTNDVNNKSVKKDVDVNNKLLKKDADVNGKVVKKDVEINNKAVKKDVEVNKTWKKDAETNKCVKKDADKSDGTKVTKRDSEPVKISKKDSVEGPKQSKREVELGKVAKKYKKETDNKLDLIKESEVVLHKTLKTEVASTSSLVVKVLKKKIRRRKAINRTGFPTLKKKKKKQIAAVLQDKEQLESFARIVDKNPKVVINVEVKKPRAENKEKKNPEGAPAPKEVAVVEKHIDNKNTDDDAMSGDDDGMTLEESEHTCSSSMRTDVDGECDGTKPCDKLCPVKYEKIQDSRMYDENATLEESLERYNQSQKIAVLSEENVRKLECANSHVSVKLEAHAFLNNNNHRRIRGSASPCILTMRNIKRLRNEYDTESDAMPSSDIASDDHDKQTSGPVRNRRKQPRWKKRYLQAGLFSDYFKEDESKKAQASDSGANKNKLAYEPSEHPHGLLPPPYHCGKFLRQRKIPFQLPYDLWWLHTHSRLPGRDLVPSWNYRKIRSNVYYDVKPTMLYEAQACECKPEAGCGDDCINRMVFSECSPQLCPCADKCKNQKIQKHDWSPGLQRFMTESKGWGVRTHQAIKSGNFILEYVGEVVSEREFKSRMATRYANDTHHYCLHLDGGLVIDGHRMGGDGRFVNHSCEPNCDMQKWSVHGLPRMALFASRDIEAGEELTYDYNFALFNPSEGQECRCGSESCRGVIGGKSQRVARPSAPANQTIASGSPANPTTVERRSVGRPRKNARKINAVDAQPAQQQQSNPSTNPSDGRKSGLCKKRRMGPDGNPLPLPVPKPLSHQQRGFVLEHRCFLVRAIEKIRKARLPTAQPNVQNKGATKPNVSVAVGTQVVKEKSNVDAKTSSDVFFTHLTSLTNTGSRTVRTRRLAQAQDDPEVNKTAKLAKVLKDLYSVMTSAKDENEDQLCAPFITLPPKRRLSEYYEKVLEPIDLTTIEQNIENGQYKTPEQFDQDVIKMFDNNVRFFGRTSDIGISAARLRKLYLGSKKDFVVPITEATGSPPSQAFLPPRGSTAGEEDVIRCICGLHRDEGIMIQCERCLVWQHCDCVKADGSAESYLCERCQPREVDYEIPLENEDDEDGKKYYVTLMRGDLQLRTGDTVYVLRDTPEKHTYKTIEKFDSEEMDIFRIERLYKDQNGERFVFGHHYLRPHETYHEPTRKFYENEVVCAPLYEAVSCDLVADRCWVLDVHTFCKGRPVNASPEHIYVCEYRVDRAARLFTKVARSRHQICTKPYAFETFPERIKHYRTYFPHSLEGIQMTKGSKDRKKNNSEAEPTTRKSESRNKGKSNKRKPGKSRGRKRLTGIPVVNVPVNVVQREDRKKRLNSILLNLLDKLPNKNEPVDASNLLERNRRNRKRPGILNP